MVAPKQFLDYVDGHRKQFIDRLGEAIAIPRCALQPDARYHNDRHFPAASAGMPRVVKM